MYKDTQAWVNSARTIDEPYVIDTLKKYGITARQGSKSDDLAHTDLFIDFGDGEVSVDVKRNYASQASSPNFTFTFVNGLGESFPFKEDAYFAFINDTNGEVYLLSHKEMKRFINIQRAFSSKFSPKSKYILIPKETLKARAESVYKGDVSKLK